MNRTLLNRLALAMTHYESGCPERVQHFIKVHAFSRLMGELEELDEETLFTLETAAYVHDIGIRKALEVYGSDAGSYQEELGPEIAKNLLESLGFSENIVSRVCYLVGHHHTYDSIKGMDYQLLVEADFLVNLYENHRDIKAVRAARERIFRSAAGCGLCDEMFGL